MAPKLALLFPGQGAQHVGMGRAFYDASPDIQALYKQANRLLGYDLMALCFEGDPEELKRTDRCQPAIYLTSIAAWTAWRLRAAGKPMPQATCGLSLGEYAALTAAEVIGFEEGLKLVQTRGEAMERASREHPGTLLAVFGMPREALETLCQQAGAEVANLNSPGQVVVSGSLGAIEQLEQLAKEAGAKRTLRLEVGGAFHSSLMQPAGREMQKALAQVAFRKPKVPVVCNVTGTFEYDPDLLKQHLIAQLTRPTLWEASMRLLLKEGITSFVEFAPGKVLTGLLKRIDPNATAVKIETPADLSGLLTTRVD